MFEQRFLPALLFAFLFPTGEGNASVIYDFDAPCQLDCGPVGVVGATSTVTGFLELDIADSPVTQNWTESDIVDFAFDVGGFVIQLGNTTLSHMPGGAGDYPFTTNAEAPFSNHNAYLMATYVSDPSISIIIGDNAINLIQRSLTCFDGGAAHECQTMALTDFPRDTWERRNDSSLPLPATSLLLAIGGFFLRERKGESNGNMRSKKPVYSRRQSNVGFY